jgi:hypothetical protein
MGEKSGGFDLDREMSAQSKAPAKQGLGLGIIVAPILILAVVFLAYRFLPMAQHSSGDATDPVLFDLDRRLGDIETRLDKLDKLEAARKTAGYPSRKSPTTSDAGEGSATPAAVKPAVRTVYQISPPPRQTHATASSAPVDSAVAQRLPAIQQGLADLQDTRAADQEAWKATTDRLADVAGQVGTQGVQILQSQDELNQLLSRTEMEAIPFELHRGSDPQPVGPVTLSLKSSNPKTQRYTVCVYAQSVCIELKDRTRHEVVQFVVSRNTTALEFIATRIMKDGILGYIEVPRDQAGH